MNIISGIVDGTMDKYTVIIIIINITIIIFIIIIIDRSLIRRVTTGILTKMFTN